tara:strand:- start:54 stop:989 length:936 start_codon:yes stop_codon:yes gene_type:complete
MEEKLIIRLSNNLGNQMFMYAAGYAASKKMKRNFYFDKVSSYNSYKNIYKFSLDRFKLTEKSLEPKYLFNGLSGYLKRKLLKKIDIFKLKKNFLLEKKDSNKKTFYDEKLFKYNYADTVYMEGYFESEKYFSDYANEIKKQFIPKQYNDLINNKYLPKIRQTDSVSLCIRQNRFSEKYGKINVNDDYKSNKFLSDQINYIHKAISYFRNKLNNPVFYLWSNNLKGLQNKLNIKNIIFINNEDIEDDIERIHCDLFLMTNCKHFAVIPSAFNWWGCWLSNYKDGIILRPNNNHFTNFEIKNKDYWPLKWKEI